MNGPYQTEPEALDDCAAVYDAMRVSTGLMQQLNSAVLEDACRDEFEALWELGDLTSLVV